MSSDMMPALWQKDPAENVSFNFWSIFISKDI